MSARPQGRRLVSALFIDVVDSTALGESLDPETLREVMGDYFAAVKACVHRHGGTVEKFIGDAVLAIFGAPTVHEDDALRAVRAALDVRAAVGQLNTALRPRDMELRIRAGINTGEAVLGPDRAGGSFATGDTVNVAARLEQAAAPGQILLGGLTHELVAHQVWARPLPRVAAKGRARPVPAWRLEALNPAAGPEGGCSWAERWCWSSWRSHWRWRRRPAARWPSPCSANPGSARPAWRRSWWRACPAAGWCCAGGA